MRSRINANLRRVARILLSCQFVILLALLVGCVAGQSINLDYNPEAGGQPKQVKGTRLQVTDERPYVKAGDKNPSYIGHYRAGFGNTWDVSTQNSRPLAKLMEEDLTRELAALGFVTDGPGAERMLRVSIKDWNFDAYANGKLWYQVEVTVEGPDGAILARSELEDKRVIKGSVLVGAKYAFQREVPDIYRALIRRIVRENPDILKALTI
jgi:hypothetical protein